VWAFKTFRKGLFVFFGFPATPKGADAYIDLKYYADFQLKRLYGPLAHFCFAPHTSMFFSLHGKMAPCYATYNEKSDIFGDTTISESWFEGSFAEIRKEHADCQFEENCMFCYNLFKNKTYGSMLQQKYEHYAFSKRKYPVIMEFELSNRCNLECIMCDSNLSSSIRKKSNADAIHSDAYNDDFLEQLKEFIPHLQMAEFTGGDPFLIEIYYKIWDMIITLNPKCEILITTNANTMNERILRLMERTKKIHFNVSVDALNKELYESIRKNGSFENALKNIDIFNNYCKKNNTGMNLLVCPMTVNRYEIPELIKFGNSKKIGVFFHTVVKPQHLSLKYQSPGFLEELIGFLSGFTFKTNTANERKNTENYINLIKLLQSWKLEKEVEITKQTLKRSTELVYDRIIQSKNTEIIGKIQEIIDYFNTSKQTTEMSDVLNFYDEAFLYQQCISKSTKELIKFVEAEIEKQKKSNK